VNDANTLIALIVFQSSNITVSSLSLSSKTINRSTVALSLAYPKLSKILPGSKYYIGFYATSIYLSSSTTYSTPYFSMYLMSSSTGETCQQFQA
jgi:hypothetical protein